MIDKRRIVTNFCFWMTDFAFCFESEATDESAIKHDSGITSQYQIVVNMNDKTKR